MRLIRTRDLRLEDFPFDPLQYAILSHRWGPPKEEVLFQDMMGNLERARAKLAFHKIREICRLAEGRGLYYFWIDTCCINKESSAELQEAINSIFQWYKNAAICFAYLEDVYATPSDVSSDFESQFRASRWFTRGWTLQELIAPRTLLFYNRDWIQVGAKAGLLTQVIENTTSIPSGILSGEDSHESASIAQRMSWASHRVTSRREDIAYCLLGIFSVNMAMLYGEGDSAFIRLQQEILSKNYDETIFAWCDPECPIRETRGLLAEHPRCFRNSGQVVPVNILDVPFFNHRLPEPPMVTGRGLKLQAMLLPFERGDIYGEDFANLGISLTVDVWIMPIECEFKTPTTSYRQPNNKHILGILLMRSELISFTRLNPSRLITLPPTVIGKFGSYTVFIPQTRYSWPYVDVTLPSDYELQSGYSSHDLIRVDPLKSGSCMNDFTTFAWAVTLLSHPGAYCRSHVEISVLQRGKSMIATLWINVKESDIDAIGSGTNALREDIKQCDYYTGSWTVTEHDQNGSNPTNTFRPMGSVARLGEHCFRVDWDLPRKGDSFREFSLFVVKMWSRDEEDNVDHGPRWRGPTRELLTKSQRHQEGEGASTKWHGGKVGKEKSSSHWQLL